MRVELQTPGILWDLEKPNIPPRSLLYHLEPIGVGTPYVESLTGYVARLAETHSVVTGMLILSEIAPLIREEYVFESRCGGLQKIYDRKARRALNGTGPMAHDLVQALEALTMLSQLRFLTMLTWANVLPQIKLLRSVWAWCPACYEEWRMSEQVIYEPLLWSLNAVRVCLRHHQRLVARCPHCQGQLLPLAWRSRPGYCSKCGGWLGISKAAEVPDSEVWAEDELKRQLWVVDTLGDLVATAPRLSSPLPKVRVTQAISACVNLVTKGNLSAFARWIGVPPSNVQSWYQINTLPQLDTLLHICYCLGTSLLDFLAEEAVVKDSLLLVTQPPIPLQRQKRTVFKRPLDLEQLRQTLLSVLNESPPPSLKAVVKRLGYIGNTTLYKHFPDLCHAIAVQHANYRKNNRREQMHSHLLSVLDSDEYPPPSLQQVARRIKIHHTTLHKHFPDLCREISDRYISHSQESSRQHRGQLRQEVRQVAIELDAKGVNPTNTRVALLLTKPGAMKNRYALAALREVRHQLGWET